MAHPATINRITSPSREVSRSRRRRASARSVLSLEQARVERGCFLEVNAQPDRLDLDDAHCQFAKELGLKVAISTDAHSVADLDLMRFGLDQARRGWLEPADVLNTRTWPQLRKLLRRV